MNDCHRQLSQASFLSACCLTGLMLLVQANVQAQSQPIAAHELVAALNDLSVPNICRKLLSEEIRSEPAAFSWTTRIKDGRRAALVAMPLRQPFRAVFVPNALKEVQARCLDELLREEASWQTLTERGMSDSDAIDDVIDLAVRGGSVSGRVKPEASLAVKRKGFVLGIAIARSTEIQAAWTSPPTLSTLSKLYRKSIVCRSNGHIEANDYEAAANQLRRLIQDGFSEPIDHVVFAECLLRCDSKQKSFDVLSGAFQRHGNQANEPWLTAVGDGLLRINTPESLSLAEDVFERAIAELATEAQPVHSALNLPFPEAIKDSP